MENMGNGSRPITVKAAAGKLLLYIYKLQRTAPLDMLKRQIVFVDKQSRGVSLTSDKVWLAKDLLEIAGGSDIYNAFQFLLNQHFIAALAKSVPNARIYAEIELTAIGFMIVEDIEQGNEGAQAFRDKFNLDVHGGQKIDRVIEEQLSSLAGAS